MSVVWDCLAAWIKAAAAARTWATVPGALSNAPTAMVWMESMISSAGAAGSCKAVKMSSTNVADASCTWVPERPSRPAPRLDLLDCLFPGYIQARSGGTDPRGDLEQQRRFADARIATDQDRRAGDETAATDPVELRNAGDSPRRVALDGGRNGTVFQPLAAVRNGFGAGRRRGFLDHGVPCAAALASADPTGMDTAALLANKPGLGAGHGQRPGRV